MPPKSCTERERERERERDTHTHRDRHTHREREIHRERERDSVRVSECFLLAPDPDGDIVTLLLARGKKRGRDTPHLRNHQPSFAHRELM